MIICPRCGQENSDNSSSCESCFTPLETNSPLTQYDYDSSSYDINKSDRITSSLAIGGMLLGIGSILTCCTSAVTGLYIPGILGLSGLTLSLLGRKEILGNQDTRKGKELVIIGLIFNTISFLGSFITIILWLLGVMAIESIIDYLPHLK